MFRDARFRLLASYLVLIFLALGLAGAACFYVTWADALARARERLASKADELQGVVLREGSRGQALEMTLQAWATGGSGSSTVEVRFVDLQGRPLLPGEPGIPPDEARRILDAPRRPDAPWASETARERRLHLAVPLSSGGVLRGVADVSTSLGFVAGSTGTLQKALALIGAGLTCLALLASHLLARRLFAPLEQIRSVAARMAGGELSIRLAETGDDEFGGLRRTINALGEDLERNFNLVVDEKDKRDSILSSLVDGVVTTRHDRSITFLNHTAARILTDWEAEQGRRAKAGGLGADPDGSTPAPDAAPGVASVVRPREEQAAPPIAEGSPVPPTEGAPAGRAFPAASYETAPLVEDAPRRPLPLPKVGAWRDRFESGGTGEGPGWGRESRFLGRNLATLLEPAPLSELVEAALAAGSPVQREATLGERCFTVFALPVGESAEDGRERDLLFLLRDVTALRQVETARSQFLGNVSHELKTPLTIIKGFVITLLKSPGMTEEWKRYLEFIDRETDRLSRLVDDVLNLARLRSGRAQLNLGFCEPGELLRETGRQLEAQAARYETHLALDCPAELPVLLADSDRFKEIVINLVDNAFKHTPPRGRVELQVRATPEHLVLKVRDSGPGIPEAEIPFLFERFFRGTGRGGRKSGGTGIGLAIVKEIVDAHRGRIAVESRPGGGTTFTVSLPLRTSGKHSG